MTLVASIGKATLYLGDCRDILPGLPLAAEIVSDVPYGKGYQHSGKGGATSNLQGSRAIARRRDKIVGDDRPFDPRHLLGRPCVIFGADNFAHLLPASGSFHVWDKHCGRANLDDSFSDAELIWSSRKTKTKVKRHLWKGLLREKESNAGPKLHPSQKPEAVMEWCIRELAGPGIIIDPYMGSGTTGVAAVKLGRPFIGIEEVEEYFDISCRRIDEAQRQNDMFAGDPALFGDQQT